MEQKIFQRRMLQAEIAALLHDIGKFTPEFLQKKNRPHTNDYVQGLCLPELQQVLAAPVPADCFHTPANGTKLHTLSDLICWHHEKGFGEVNTYYDADQEKGIHLPMELYLLMYADTIDSASSKGGAVFKEGNGRKARLDRSCAAQQEKSLYLATPFGEEGKKLDLNEVKEKSTEFQQALTKILAEFSAACTNHDQLKEIRHDLLCCLEQHLSSTLAETRIPNNDVTLWQHSYSTAAIFKAMLAGHLLTGDDTYCDDKGYLTQYREPLAILGVCWSEDQLISRSFRPAEILGRRLRLDTCVEKLKETMETVHCLGNEIYRDRDGIYFLVPARSRDGQERKEIQSALGAVTSAIDPILNGEKGLGGELQWQARYLDVGLQITRLPEVMAANGSAAVVLAAGPARPQWTAEWEGKVGKDICPRCGCRPIDLRRVTSGSEGDEGGEGGACAFCVTYNKEGGNFRVMIQGDFVNPQDQRKGRRLLAVDRATSFLQFDITKYFGQDGDEGRSHRLALIQGIVDLRPLLSGRAFSSILAVRPEWYRNPKGEKDLRSDMNTWDDMLSSCKEAWANLDAGNGTEKEAKKSRHTLQQLFCDTYLCTDGDGRAAGKDGDEKARNFLRHTVLAAPFAEGLGQEHEKLVNYALRQHPAPSRLARVWEATLGFSRFPIAWCEQNQITYTTIAIDPGRVLLLVAADRAWDLCHAIHDEYSRRFGRLRHLLPLHLSATIFYHKAPLYIAIDAARRFAGLGLENSAGPEWWKVIESKRIANGTWRLCLHDQHQRETVWDIPTTLPDGRDDQHYGWYWKKDGTGHPVPLAELAPNDEIAVFPATFDYEVLDSTTRRYDIRPQDDKTRQRPHSFLPHGGPRPYPLSTLGLWQQIKGSLNGVEKSQRKALIELLARLHREWGGARYNAGHANDLRNLAEDGIKNTLGKNMWNNHGSEVLSMACNGSLFDLMEWLDYINR